MINYLRHMAVFEKAVNKGAFRSAAKELGVSPSRVSQTISDLEEYLGITLFYRTTRKLALTSDGERFYTHVSKMMRSAESGLNELNALSQKPIGTLKLTLPSFLECSPVSSAIADFVRYHPDVSVSLNYTDQVVDIINEGLDLRICAGVSGIKDSSMTSRKLAQINRLLVASKVYCDKHTPPQHPSELKNWDWIRFQMRSNTIEFSSPSKKTINIEENSRLSVNSANAMRYFVTQDMGITVLPENLAEDGLKSGEIIHVLPKWQVKPLECYAVWPDQSRRENLTMIFVRYLAEHELLNIKTLE